MPWAGLVFDEAHYLKNHTSARSRLARQLADQAQKRRRPRPGGLPADRHAADQPAARPLRAAAARRPFARAQLPVVREALLRGGKNDYGWQTRGASNIEELTVQLHGVMLRRSKDQVLALPPKLRTWLPVEVPKGTGVRDMRKVVELLIGERGPRARLDDRRAPPARPSARTP